MARARKSQPDASDGDSKAPPAVEEDVAESASPPCLIHEVDPAYMGLAPEPPPSTRKKRRVS
jgi:hypothetical protein